MKSGYDILCVIATFFINRLQFSLPYNDAFIGLKFGLSFGLTYKNNPVYREIYRVIETDISLSEIIVVAAICGISDKLTQAFGCRD